MFLLTQSSARMSGARRSQGLRRFARVLVAAWVMFWLNTALFPCCEALAAVLGGHAANATQTAREAPPLHHSDNTHCDPLEHSSNSPCGDSLISGIPLAVEYKGLTPDRSPPEWCAVDAPLATSFTAPVPSAIFALARASPPPYLRLYLRTQRLLI